MEINSCKCTNNKSQVANKIIFCYKVFAVSPDGEYYGPYTGHHFGRLKEFDEITVPEPIKVFGIQIWHREEVWKVDGEWNITKGFIHTLRMNLMEQCRHPSEALQYFLRDSLYKDTRFRFELWEAAIPIGTRYYENNIGRGHCWLSGSYASKSIILFRKIV